MRAVGAEVSVVLIEKNGRVPVPGICISALSTPPTRTRTHNRTPSPPPKPKPKPKDKQPFYLLAEIPTPLIEFQSWQFNWCLNLRYTMFELLSLLVEKADGVKAGRDCM